MRMMIVGWLNIRLQATLLTKLTDEYMTINQTRMMIVGWLNIRLQATLLTKCNWWIYDNQPNENDDC